MVFADKERSNLKYDLKPISPVCQFNLIFKIDNETSFGIHNFELINHK